MMFARPVKLEDDAPHPLPNRQLFDFGRTELLAPGASTTLHLTATNEGVALAGWDGSRKVRSPTSLHHTMPPPL